MHCPHVLDGSQVPNGISEYCFSDLINERDLVAQFVNVRIFLRLVLPYVNKLWCEAQQTPPPCGHLAKGQKQQFHYILSSGGARILEQVGPAAGPKVVW